LRGEKQARKLEEDQSGNFREAILPLDVHMEDVS